MLHAEGLHLEAHNAAQAGLRIEIEQHHKAQMVVQVVRALALPILQATMLTNALVCSAL